LEITAGRLNASAGGDSMSRNEAFGAGTMTRLALAHRLRLARREQPFRSRGRRFLFAGATGKIGEN